MGEWLYYNITTTTSFHTKKLCSRLYSIEIEFYFWKTKTSYRWDVTGFRVVSKYPQSIVWFCHKARVWQTDGQNYDYQDSASIAASRGKNE